MADRKVRVAALTSTRHGAVITHFQEEEAKMTVDREDVKVAPVKEIMIS